MIDHIIIDLLGSNRIFKEGFSNNKRISSSDSFEEHISKKLISVGFIDYSNDWEQFKKEKNIKTFLIDIFIWTVIFSIIFIILKYFI